MLETLTSHTVNHNSTARSMPKESRHCKASISQRPLSKAPCIITIIYRHVIPEAQAIVVPMSIDLTSLTAVD